MAGDTRHRSSGGSREEFAPAQRDGLRPRPCMPAAVVRPVAAGRAHDGIPVPVN
jgi:hypothetical protein